MVHHETEETDPAITPFCRHLGCYLAGVGGGLATWYAMVGPVPWYMAVFLPLAGLIVYALIVATPVNRSIFGRWLGLFLPCVFGLGFSLVGEYIRAGHMESVLWRSGAFVLVYLLIVFSVAEIALRSHNGGRVG